MGLRLRDRLAPWFRDLGGEPLVVIAGSCALLMLGHYQGSTKFFRATFGKMVEGHPAAHALPYFWWFGCAVLLYLAAPLLLAKLTRGGWVRHYGLGLGDWRAGLSLSALFLLVMLPAVWVAAGTDVFARQYPLAGQSAFNLSVEGKAVRHLGLFALYEAAYFAYFIGWEFLFRGWMLNGLLPRFGRGGAILVQTAPFALMHLGKPEAEALGSIVAGIALGVLALRTRSFWYGAFLHGVIAVWMDVLAAWPYLSRP